MKHSKESVIDMLKKESAEMPEMPVMTLTPLPPLPSGCTIEIEGYGFWDTLSHEPNSEYAKELERLSAASTSRSNRKKFIAFLETEGEKFNRRK